MREAVVLTFDAARPPALRSSADLGCELQAIVTPPAVSAQTKRVLWTAAQSRQAVRAQTAKSPPSRWANSSPEELSP